MAQLKDVKGALVGYGKGMSPEVIIGQLNPPELAVLLTDIFKICNPELMRGIIPTLSQWFDTISLLRADINPNINNNLSDAYETEQRTIHEQIDQFLSYSEVENHKQLADDAIISFISLMSFVE